MEAYHILYTSFVVIIVRSLSRVQLFVTPWAAVCQAPLSFTISWSLLRFMSIKSVMPSNLLILCCPLLLLPSTFPASGSFPMSWLFPSGDQSIGASASASVLPMNSQGWFPLGLIDLISLQSIGLLSIFSSTTIQKQYWMLGAGALGWPRGMEWGGRREEGSGWGTHVYLWQIHFAIWQN